MRKKPNRKPNTTCDLCGEKMYRRPSTMEKNQKKLCSRSCRNKMYPLAKEQVKGYKFPTGELNPAWKGGITLKRPKGNYKGVRYVRCPQEWKQMARKDGYIMEHRLVMAQHLNRTLKREEVVHHIDHNPANNKIENLMLFATNSLHKKYEALEKNGVAGETPSNLPTSPLLWLANPSRVLL